MLVPNLKVGEPVSPGPYGCCAYGVAMSVIAEFLLHITQGVQSHFGTEILGRWNSREGETERKGLKTPDVGLHVHSVRLT